METTNFMSCLRKCLATALGALAVFGVVGSQNANAGTQAHYPYAAVVSAGTNLLWGTGSGGGANALGAVYTWNTNTTTYTTRHSFAGFLNTGLTNDGALPYGSLIKEYDTSNNYTGYLLGTTSSGGNSYHTQICGQFGVTCPIPYNYGTIYEIKDDGTGYNTVGYFTGPTGSGLGANPHCALLQRYDYTNSHYVNEYYGTTITGDANAGGNIFQFVPNATRGSVGTITSVHVFPTPCASDQGAPASLVQAADNCIYGTHATCGTDVACGGSGIGHAARGYVFKWAFTGATGYAGSFSTIAGAWDEGSSCTPPEPLRDGGWLVAPLLYTNSKFYCISQGSDNFGSVWDTPTTGSATTVVNIDNQFDSGTTDGIWPEAALCLASSDSNLYGTTTETTFQSGAGTLYQLTTGGAYAHMLDFPNVTNGPVGCTSQLVDIGGTLYGTSVGGGADAAGCIYTYVGGATSVTLVYSFN